MKLIYNARWIRMITNFVKVSKKYARVPYKFKLTHRYKTDFLK